MSLRSSRICEVMKSVLDATMISRKYMARVRVPAGRLAGRQPRFGATRFESCGPVANGTSSGVRPSHEHRIFPVIGLGRRGKSHRQPGTEEGRIEARRPARIVQICEPTGRANPYKLALGLLKHPDRQLSGAAHRGRSVKNTFPTTALLQHYTLIHIYTS